MSQRTITIQCDKKWFDLILSGLKSVVAREYTGEYIHLKPNDIIKFYDVETKRSFLSRIDEVRLYSSLEVYFQDVGVKSILPGVTNLQEAIAVYHQWCDPEQIKRYGLIAMFVD